ncbi:hypothetical protein H6B10_17010, partial [Gemmiger formicilis]|uniref:hypothetical protein n=1 Tax=Gemmiger formicilis TaxID=745368 RepID=UPI00195DBA21
VQCMMRCIQHRVEGTRQRIYRKTEHRTSVHADGTAGRYADHCERKRRMKLLNEILGTRYPLIQGGMANIATGE